MCETYMLNRVRGFRASWDVEGSREPDRFMKPEERSLTIDDKLPELIVKVPLEIRYFGMTMYTKPSYSGAKIATHVSVSPWWNEGVDDLVAHGGRKWRISS
jgi:hypothetical protein